MKFSFRVGANDVTLRVPGPQGLVEPEPPEHEFVIKMMSKAAGMALYKDLVDYASEKPAFFADQMAKGHDDYEMPFVARDSVHTSLRVRNDAHIIAALARLGATHIPVQIHQSDAHLLD